MSEARGRVSSLRTVGSFLNGRACSDTLFHVLDRALDHALPEEERAVVPLAGGIMQHGYQCGMIWGSALAAGAQAYRLLGAGPRAEATAIAAAGKIVESFRALTSHVDCFDITGLDDSSTTRQMFTHFFVKGGSIRCFRMAASYAPIALDAIETVLSGPPVEAPPAPVSCAAMVARKMGAGDEHAVMAAGLAGGIGLCGGACGALGAAIWITGLNGQREGAGKPDHRSPRAREVIERFLPCTRYEFECAAVVGRKFEGVADHAAWLRGGGCSKIIEVLAGGEAASRAAGETAKWPTLAKAEPSGGGP